MYVTIPESVLPLALREALKDPRHNTSDDVVEVVQRSYYSCSEPVRREIQLLVGGAASKDEQWGQLLAELCAQEERRRRITEEYERYKKHGLDPDGWDPDNGYPSDDELEHVRNFVGTAQEFMSYVTSIWRGGAGVAEEHCLDEFTGDALVRVTLVTGGWSGCESVINTVNDTLMSVYLRSWSAGGLWVFEFPLSVCSQTQQMGVVWKPTPESEESMLVRSRDRIAHLEQQLAQAKA